MLKANNWLLLPVLIALLSACSLRPPSLPGLPGAEDGAPARRLDPNSIPTAVPRVEPLSRRGNPDSYVVNGRRYYVLNDSHGYTEQGIASWYGTKFHGRTTSSGEPYDMYAMTAAHKSLPLPTYVEVTNLRNGRQIIVKVNDRGPFHGNRIIDLSYAAATKLGILGEGTGLVQVRAINPGLRPVAAMTSSPTPRVESQALDLFIQVGAFSSESTALRLQSRLSAPLNRDVRIQQASVGGRPIYRVQVGPLASVQLADNVTEQLLRLGIGETRVVIE